MYKLVQPYKTLYSHVQQYTTKNIFVQACTTFTTRYNLYNKMTPLIPLYLENDTLIKKLILRKLSYSGPGAARLVLLHGISE